MMKDECKVEISLRAMRGMKNDLSIWSCVETGGVLLGYSTPTLLRIVEAIDGGYANAERERGCFSFDHQYVTHVSNYVANLYQPPLDLIGFWHKHNHDYEPCLSAEDIKMQENLVKTSASQGCTILFQKTSDKGDAYNMRIFVTTNKHSAHEVHQSNIIIN